jgi:predicted N-acyltransferase
MTELLEKWRARLATQPDFLEFDCGYYKALKHCIQDLEQELERQAAREKLAQWEAVSGTHNHYMTAPTTTQSGILVARKPTLREAFESWWTSRNSSKLDGSENADTGGE